MVIKIKKETIIALLLLLPYAEGLFSFLTVYKNYAIFRAILILEILVCLLLSISLVLNRRKVSCKENKLEFLFIIYCAISLMWTDAKYVTVSTFLWIVVPIIYSILVYYYVKKKSLNIDLILKYIIIYMACYCCFALLRNIVRNNLFFDRSVRLNSPGGGSVIFGYTLAIFVALLYMEKCLFTIKCKNIILCIYAITIFASGSRGAMYPAIMIVLGNFLLNMKTRKGMFRFIFIVSGLLLSAVFFNPINVLQGMFPRLFQYNEIGSRSISAVGVFNIFNKSDLIYKLIGYGLGMFFPYQEWVYCTTRTSGYTQGNLITRMGEVILVQPHNTWQYILIELGIVGVLLFTLIFFKYLRTAINMKNAPYIVLLITTIFVNMFDSIFFVEPGTAGTIWIILLLAEAQVARQKNLRSYVR